jgi:hypothetical protein
VTFSVVVPEPKLLLSPLHSLTAPNASAKN